MNEETKGYPAKQGTSHAGHVPDLEQAMEGTCGSELETSEPPTPRSDVQSEGDAGTPLTDVTHDDGFSEETDRSDATNGFAGQDILDWLIDTNDRFVGAVSNAGHSASTLCSDGDEETPVSMVASEGDSRAEDEVDGGVFGPEDVMDEAFAPSDAPSDGVAAEDVPVDGTLLTASEAFSDVPLPASLPVFETSGVVPHVDGVTSDSWVADPELTDAPAGEVGEEQWRHATQVDLESTDSLDFGDSQSGFETAAAPTDTDVGVYGPTGIFARLWDFVRGRGASS